MKEHIEFSPNKQTLLAPSAKRREVLGESHEGWELHPVGGGEGRGGSDSWRASVVLKFLKSFGPVYGGLSCCKSPVESTASASLEDVLHSWRGGKKLRSRSRWCDVGV